MPAANQPRQREIRVFISSTFRDMQEERELSASVRDAVGLTLSSEE